VDTDDNIFVGKEKKGLQKHENSIVDVDSIMVDQTGLYRLKKIKSKERKMEKEETSPVGLCFSRKVRLGFKSI
jgi:hypothetical protein